jgi:hypothetical protein
VVAAPEPVATLSACGALRYPVVAAAAVASVGVPLWSAFIADVDGVLPWALVIAGCVAAAVLGFFAFGGLRQSDRHSRNIQSLSTANSQAYLDIRSLSVAHSQTEQRIDRLATDPDCERNEAIMAHFGLLQKSAADE